MTDACPFCQSKITHRALEETKLSVIFLSNPRITKGHTIIIPKRHVWEPWKLTKAEQDDILNLSNVYRQKLQAVLDGGTDLVQNHRPFLEPSKYHNIRHLHYHIVPRYMFDEQYQATSYEQMFTMLSDPEFDEMTKALT